MDFKEFKNEPIKIVTESMGTLCFHWLSINDLIFIEDLLDEKIEPKDFTIKVLHHQLLESTISINEMSIWEDKFIISIATEWLKNPMVLNQQIPKGQNSYNEFYNAFKNYQIQYREKWQNILKNFSNNFGKIGEFSLSITKMIPDYSILTNKLTEVMEKTRQQIQQIFEPMRVILDKYQEQASQIARVTNTISYSLAQAVESYQFKITDFISKLPDPVEILEYWKEIDEAEQLLQDGGFGFLNQLWTSSYIIELKDVPKEVRTAVITNQLLFFSRSQDFYNELKTEFENCQLIKKRWVVIESALEAHKSRKYFLSVPAFLTQVEGILTDIIVLRGEAKLIKGKLYARDNNGNLKKDKKGEPIKLTGLQKKIQHSRFKNNIVLENISALMVSSLIKDRNKIMHGQSLSPIKPKLSLQCLFLLLVLSKEINAFLGNSDGTAANTASALTGA